MWQLPSVSDKSNHKLPCFQLNHQCRVIRLEALKLFSRGYKAPWKKVCGVSGSYCHTIAVLCAEIETLYSWQFSQINSVSSGGKCSIPKSLWEKHTVWKRVLLVIILQKLRPKSTSFPLLSTKGAWKDCLTCECLLWSKRNFLSPFIHPVLDPKHMDWSVAYLSQSLLLPSQCSKVKSKKKKKRNNSVKKEDDLVPAFIGILLCDTAGKVALVSQSCCHCWLFSTQLNN